MKKPFLTYTIQPYPASTAAYAASIRVRGIAIGDVMFTGEPGWVVEVRFFETKSGLEIRRVKVLRVGKKK